MRTTLSVAPRRGRRRRARLRGGPRCGPRASGSAASSRRPPRRRYDVRARADVDVRDRAAERRADARERPCRARAPCAGSRRGRSGRRRPSAAAPARRSRAGRSRSGSRRPGAVSSGKRARTLAASSGVHDDRGRRCERAAASRASSRRAVEPARIDLHLVERPRIAEVGDPRHAEPRRDAARRPRRTRTATSRRRPGRPVPLRALASAPCSHQRKNSLLAAEPALQPAAEPAGRTGRRARDPADVVPAGTSAASDVVRGVQRLASTPGPVTTTAS